ncbi:MAG: hypothetical protein Q9219_006389 [cf. Caloplaca sp. 3 TL-2023]
MAIQTQTKNETAPATLTPHPSIPRGPVTATLNFYQPPADGSDPFFYVEEPPEGVPQRNFGDSSHEITMKDLRGEESRFQLDTHAFVALQDVSSKADYQTFDSDADVEKIYYPEVEALLKEKTGAKRVLLFDHTIRRTRPGAERAPVARVHIDQTEKSVHQRVRHHVPDEADQLLKGRLRIINVWRPLTPPVTAHPLAFADSQTVPDEAMSGIQHRYPDRTGETAAVQRTEGQQWWYWSGMEGTERLLLQCFDSEKGARVPHTAFVDPRSEEGVGRESIEVRALLFG